MAPPVLALPRSEINASDRQVRRASAQHTSFYLTLVVLRLLVQIQREHSHTQFSDNALLEDAFSPRSWCLTFYKGLDHSRVRLYLGRDHDQPLSTNDLLRT